MEQWYRRKKMIYQQQKQVTHFYEATLKTLLALLGLVTLFTGLKVLRNHDMDSIFSMMWYGVPPFTLAIIAGIRWIGNKRQEAIQYRQSLEVKKRRLRG
jgi:hypothetical protein